MGPMVLPGLVNYMMAVEYVAWSGLWQKTEIMASSNYYYFISICFQ